MRTILTGAMIAALAAAGSASAHHSGAMYDAATKTTVQGTVSAFQWANPHAWVQLQVVDPATKQQAKLVLESLGTNQLTRAGWHSDSLKPGDLATVVYNPLKNGELGGRLVTISVGGKVIGNRPVE